MDTCHVLRNHETESEFMGPRYLVRSASLEMHPLDTADRREYLKYDGGIGYCNINKCCTDVCPEHIRITDNAIIPLKERVADEYYDPLRMLWRKIRGDRYQGGQREQVEVSDEAKALDDGPAADLGPTAGAGPAAGSGPAADSGPTEGAEPATSGESPPATGD